MHSKKIIGALFLSFAASIWGGMFVVVKNIVSLIPPLQLVWLRYLVALLFLFIFTSIQHAKWSICKKDLGLILLIGLIGNAISIVAQETGTWLSSAQLGAVVTSATPTFMILFARFLLKEKITTTKIFSILLASIGVLTIVGRRSAGKHTLLGLCFLIIAALTWALMSVLVKMVSNRYTALQVTTLSTLVAFFCLTPFVFRNLTILKSIDFATPKVSLSILYLGAISTATAFVLWNKGLQLLNASSSGLFFLFQPIVGGVLGWWFLAETLSWQFFVGTSLIFLSIWLTIHFTEPTK